MENHMRETLDVNDNYHNKIDILLPMIWKGHVFSDDKNNLHNNEQMVQLIIINIKGEIKTFWTNDN